MPTLATSSKRSFSEFNAYEPSLVRALDACRLFVKQMLASPWSGAYCLSLTGVSGNGKTMLAECVVNEMQVDPWLVSRLVKSSVVGGRRTNFEVKFFNLRAMSDRMKNGEYAVEVAMIEPQLVVLDDLGADYDPRKVFAGKMDKVLRMRREKWTLVTSNMGLEGIANELDSRIASWLIRDRNKLVHVLAPDYAGRKP